MIDEVFWNICWWGNYESSFLPCEGVSIEVGWIAWFIHSYYQYLIWDTGEEASIFFFEADFSRSFVRSIKFFGFGSCIKVSAGWNVLHRNSENFDLNLFKCPTSKGIENTVPEIIYVQGSMEVCMYVMSKRNELTSCRNLFLLNWVSSCALLYT